MRQIIIIKKNAVIERKQPQNPTTESSESREKRWTEIDAVKNWIKIWRERKNNEISRAFDLLNETSINRRSSPFSR